jgi:crotonobetainyl-CoA:carnitine CoA-transferase CaiB-like acyl-CoA transferase
VVDVAHPVVLGGSRGPVYPAAPRMGEHTVQVMQRLGRSLDAISELQASGAIGPYVRG